MINKSMDYRKIYSDLIARAHTRSRLVHEYYEQHHIVPKCVGGTDSKENLVLLTPEEHFVAHQLLVKMYPKEVKLVYAVLMMTVSSKATSRSNKRYGWLRRRYSIECKKRTGENNPSFGSKWYHDPNTSEVKKFQSYAVVPNNWVRGRTKKSEEHVERKCRDCTILFVTNSKHKKFCDHCRKKRCSANGIETRFQKKIDDIPAVIDAIQTSKTWTECLRKLNYKSAGNSLFRVQKISRDHNVVLGSLVN
jgi:hypothetical protein